MGCSCSKKHEGDQSNEEETFEEPICPKIVSTESSAAAYLFTNSVKVTPIQSCESLTAERACSSNGKESDVSRTSRSGSEDLGNPRRRNDSGFYHLKEDIGCQTVESLPNIISDGKLLNGYYPKFSPIHADFLKAKSLEIFLQQNCIPLANSPSIEEIIVTKSNSALEVIREESDHLSNSHRDDDKSKHSSSVDENLEAHPKTSASPRIPWNSRSPRNPRSPENLRDPRFGRSAGFPRSPRRDPDDNQTRIPEGISKPVKEDDGDDSNGRYKHIDSDEDLDDDAKTMNSNFTLSIESIETDYFSSMSRASSYQTSLDFLSSEWNLPDIMRRQIFIADI